MATIQVLGISLGTRRIGLAVLQDKSLYSYDVKTFLHPWSETKYKSILAVIETYITHYSITHIALKVPALKIPSHSIASLIEGISKLSKKRKCTIRVFGIQQLKEFLSPTARGNKKSVLEGVFKQFPELGNEYRKELRNRIPYYIMLFEAVGVAAMLGSN